MANIKVNAPVNLVHHRMRLPGYVDTAVLAGAAKTFTRPTWAFWCIIKVSDICTVNLNGTAADITGADVTDGSGNFLILPTDGNEPFRFEGLAFSIFGTSRVSVAWYGDEGRP